MRHLEIESFDHLNITELRKSLGTWLREMSSCSCLTFLPGPAWVLLSKTNKPLFPPLYSVVQLTTSAAAGDGKCYPNPAFHVTKEVWEGEERTNET